MCVPQWHANERDITLTNFNTELIKLWLKEAMGGETQRGEIKALVKKKGKKVSLLHQIFTKEIR